jgi:thiol-disulfide isomerase/thioredoxin
MVYNTLFFNVLHRAPSGPCRRLKGLLGLLAVAAAGVLVLAACGGSSSTLNGTSDVVIPFDFEIFVYQGADELGAETLQFSDLFVDGKAVVLNFWASECPPCRAEMSDLQEVHDEFRDQIVLFGLDAGPFTGLGSRDDGRALLEELGVTYPAGSTNEGAVVREYRALGLPTTVFMSASGDVVRTWSGLLTKAKMVDLIQQLLAIS